MYIEIDEQLCIGCGDCCCICPAGSIDLSKGKAQIADSCICCGACLSECTRQAIKLVR